VRVVRVLHPKVQATQITDKKELLLFSQVLLLQQVAVAVQFKI
jgi:hypothetical protein